MAIITRTCPAVVNAILHFTLERVGGAPLPAGVMKVHFLERGMNVDPNVKLFPTDLVG